MFRCVRSRYHLQNNKKGHLTFHDRHQCHRSCDTYPSSRFSTVPANRRTKSCLSSKRAMYSDRISKHITTRVLFHLTSHPPRPTLPQRQVIKPRESKVLRHHRPRPFKINIKNHPVPRTHLSLVHCQNGTIILGHSSCHDKRNTIIHKHMLTYQRRHPYYRNNSGYLLVHLHRNLNTFHD